MKRLLRHFKANKSVLTDGLSLPKDVYQEIYAWQGKTLNKGDKVPIDLIIDNQHFSASLNNSNAKDRKDTLLQIRYSSSVGNKMRSLFQDSTSKLITDDGKATSRQKNSKPEITEYINIYTNAKNVIMYESHYKFPQAELLLIGDNLNILVAAKTKPFLILGGFSGTGKSQKVKELAYLTCPDIDNLQQGREPGNYCLISVKPNWHDSSDLLGYYSNIAKRYIVTDFVRFLVKAMRYPMIPFYVCIDEMNLAPVEEYFAEYLSVLESRREQDGRIVSNALVSADVFNDNETLSDLHLEEPKDSAVIEELKEYGLCLPQNVVVIGTVNMDDTTNSFSRKVIDRAMTFETCIEPIKAADYFSTDNNRLEYKNLPCPERLICDKVRVSDVLAEATPDFEMESGETELNTAFTDFINTINKAMGHGKNYDSKEGLGSSPFQVSYRVINEAVLLYRSHKVLVDENASLDAVFSQILLHKVLPRIEGEQDRACKPLEGLQQYISQHVGEDEAKRQAWQPCMEKIDYMLRPFGKGGDGFTTFWL